MLTEAQKQEIIKRAKAKGIKDADINKGINEYQKASFNVPVASQIQSTSVPQTTSQRPQPTQQPSIPASQPSTMPPGTPTVEEAPSFVASFVKSLVDPAVNYLKFVGEAGFQAARAIKDDSILSVGAIDQQVQELTAKSRDFIQQAKRAKDPKEKARLLDESRKIDAQIDSLGSQAGKVGNLQKTKFIEEDKIATRGDILTTGAKATAGAMAYAVPGGSTIKGAAAAGAVAGGLSSISKDDATLEDVATGLVTGAAISGVTAGVLKVFKSNLANEAGKKLDQAGNAIEEQSYVKSMGIKPLKREGGASLLGRMKKVGVVPGDADAVIAQTDEIFRQDGGRVLDATKQLGQKGVKIKVEELRKVLVDQLEAAKSVVSKKPIQEVLDILDDDLAGQTTISPEDLYLLKSEYGGLGKWNSLSSEIEKKQAAAWQDVYFKANEMIDKTLKNNGFEEFVSINERLHTATQAAQWATRKADVAPNRYNIGLYDWMAGVSGAVTTGNVVGGAAAMAGKKVLESPKTSGVIAKIMQRAGQKLTNVGPINATVPQNLVNMGIIGTTQQLGSDSVSGINEEENQANQQAGKNNLNQITPPGSTLPQVDSRIPQATPSPMNPFGGLSKRQVLALALSSGAKTGDLKEIGEIYDMMAADTNIVGEETMQIANSLRTEYFTRTQQNGFLDITNAYKKVVSAPDTPAGDVSIIFAYMKMLDPTSAVREGEFATAEKTAGIPEQVVNAYNRARSGKRLGAKQRADYINSTNAVYQQYQSSQAQIDALYQGLANKYGIDPALVGIGTYAGQ